MLELMLELDCVPASRLAETLGAACCSAGARIGRHGHTFADAHAGRDASSAITGIAIATAAAIVTKTAATLSTRIARSTPQP